jgi:Ca2+-binding EF-hand superfamily protein
MRTLIALALCLAVLPCALSREPRSERLFEQWKRADADGNGALSRSEVAAMPALAPRFDLIDRDGNGEITAEEVRAWRTARRSRRASRQPSGLGALFAEADRNGDGMLSRAEVQARLPRMARNFDRIDANRDGSLGRAEIEQWVARRRASRVKAGG